MTLRLNYILGETIVTAKKFTPEADGWLEWLYFMIEKNPKMNFFFTEETTDIWGEEESDYYDDWQDAMDTDFEPKTPCMYLDTRPCEVIKPVSPGAEVSTYFFPKQRCQTKCQRFQKVIVRGGNTS